MSGALPRWAVCGFARIVCLLALACLQTSLLHADDVLATVDGESISESDLQLEVILRQIPTESLPEHREQLIQQLIDQQILTAFLKKRRVQANPTQLQTQLERIEALIRRRGEEPEALFTRLGLSLDQVRDRLASELAWKTYVAGETSNQELAAYFHKHRRELDGTQLRARHIVVTAPPDDDAARAKARTELTGIRRQIQQQDLTFEAAAAEHSQAPSKEQGGDVGYFAHRGTMPAAFADAAFALSPDEISEPVETPFGVHLIQVTDERPGQLSLEDVRREVLERISQNLRSELLEVQRSRARIERP